jgi:hypothetical protein
VSVSYDWHSSEHIVDIGVSGHDGVAQFFRIVGLSNYCISEDFRAMYIEHCTLTSEPGRVYLSLDPYMEGTESERDNYIFVGTQILVSATER